MEENLQDIQDVENADSPDEEIKQPQEDANAAAEELEAARRELGQVSQAMYRDSAATVPGSQFLLGAESLIYVMIENTSFIARVKPRSNIYVGDTMRFAINPNKVHVFDKETENIITN